MVGSQRAHVVDRLDHIVAGTLAAIRTVEQRSDLTRSGKRDRIAEIRRIAGEEIQAVEESRYAELVDERDRAEKLLDRPQRLRLISPKGRPEAWG